MVTLNVGTEVHIGHMSRGGELTQ